MKVLTLVLTLILGGQVQALDLDLDLVKEVKLSDGRTILANNEGLTLYTFDVDEPGISNCHDNCLTVWPPILVDADLEVEAPFGKTERPTGEFQLMLNDEPLYLFFGDKKEGEIKGDNLQNVWHIIIT